MAKRRRSIKLRPDEDQVLRNLYVEFGITSDRYTQQPDDLEKFISTWNYVTDRQDEATEVLHYIFTKRKNGKWPKLGRSSDAQITTTALQEFTDEELQIIDNIYEELQIASDKFALDEDLAKQFQDEFAKRTGRIVPTLLLSAAIIRRRKAGVLATLRPDEGDDGLDFGDIDKVAS